LFTGMGKPMRAVPALFLFAILIAGVLGEAVARLFSDPMNRLLRKRFGDGSDRLGSVVKAESGAQKESHLAA
jgi:hypothetical protein